MGVPFAPQRAEESLRVVIDPAEFRTVSPEEGSRGRCLSSEVSGQLVSNTGRRGTQGKGEAILGVKRGTEGLHPFVEVWGNLRVNGAARVGLQWAREVSPERFLVLACMRQERVGESGLQGEAKHPRTQKDCQEVGSTCRLSPTHLLQMFTCLLTRRQAWSL